MADNNDGITPSTNNGHDMEAVERTDNENDASPMPVALPPASVVKPALKKKDAMGMDVTGLESGSHTPGGGGGRGGGIVDGIVDGITIHDGSGEKKHLKWDEEAIEEHDLLRGTRMKIDEPNTPFAAYDSGAESDGSYRSQRSKSPIGMPKNSVLVSGDGKNKEQQQLSWDLLETKLASVAAVRDAYPSSPSSSYGGGGADDEGEGDADEMNGEGVVLGRRSEMRKLEFQEHRKRHYNEMEAVRRYRMEHPPEDLTDEDEGADDEAP
jgi:protein phosphatase inhibitor 2